MRTPLIGTLLLALACLTGCVKQKFHYTATYDDTYPFVIDQTGQFEVSHVITPAQVNGALDIPGDATIDGLEIEELSVRVVLLPGNEARALSVSGVVQDEQRRGPVWENYPIVLSGADVPFVGLNSLIETGVTRLRGALLRYTNRLSTGFCGVQIGGDSVPAGQRVHLRIDLRVRATVKYHRCLKVPREVFDGEPCDG